MLATHAGLTCRRCKSTSYETFQTVPDEIKRERAQQGLRVLVVSKGSKVLLICLVMSCSPSAMQKRRDKQTATHLIYV